MASSDTFGLRRNVDKQIDLTIDEYIGSARPGELLVDLNPQGYLANAQYTVYVGLANGGLQPVGGGGGGGGSGTVTSVGTAGSGLGFTLTGGPIATTGTVTLGVPTAAALRTSLTIGNVANLNLDGNVSNILRGDGTFSSAPSTSSISNGTSSISIPIASGNVVTTVGGVATLTVTSTGANIAGTANVSGAAFFGANANVAGNVNATGNVVVASTEASTSTTTGALRVAGGAGIVGNIHVGGNANVAGNLYALGNSILGSNANVFITGGTAGQVLSTVAGTGALQWVTPFPVSVPDIEWAALADGTGQVFNNAELAHYNSLTSAITVFKDGAKLSNATGDYTLAGTNLTINTWIGTGSIISVGAGYRLV